MNLRALNKGKGYLDVLVDYISGCLLVKEAEHHMTHKGLHYVAQKYFDAVANGTKVNLRFKTPASTYTHMVFNAYASAGALVTVYEDSTLAHVAGNSVNIENRNRSSSNVSDFQQICYTGTGAETGTVMIPTQKMGTTGNPLSTAAGDHRDSQEYVLKPDTVYSIEVESEANGTDVNIGLDWYETDITF